MGNNSSYLPPGSHSLTLQQAIDIAIQYQNGGQLSSAKTVYEQILNQDPQQPVALHLLGVVFYQTGDNDTALELITKSLVIKPDYAEAHNNLATVYHQFERFDDARMSCQKAISLNPNYAEAYNNLAAALQQLDHFEEALTHCLKSIEIKPDYADAYNNLGAIYHKLGKVKDAISNYTKSIEHRPDNIEAHHNLAIVLAQQGRFKDAIASNEKVLAYNPEYIEALYNLGAIYYQLGKFEESEKKYIKALSIDPNYIEALCGLGSTLLQIGKIEESIETFKKAIAIKPDFESALGNLGNAYTTCNMSVEAVECYDKALQANPDSHDIHSSRVFSLNYFSDVSAKFVFESHMEFEKYFGGLERRVCHDPLKSRHPGGRLKIGYVSPDFKNHSVNYFFEPILQSHDNQAIETFCYYNDVTEDDATSRLKKLANNWRSIFELDDKEVVDLIQKDGIDILVDLAGHSSKNRLTVFAYKPAPIQVTWLGYPNTTGLKAVDYRITDKIADPVGDSDAFYVEKLIRLPNNFLCYRGNKSASANTNFPYEDTGHITFGCLNNITKITQEVLIVWSKIMKAVPDAQLLLKAKQFADPYTYSRFFKHFEKEGISKNRIILLSPNLSMEEFLALYSKIDICLDPFPFNGATTTCEALWMGVPVITFTGECHAGRMGASILSHVGLTEFLAANEEEYIQIAIQMASNTDYLKEVRLGLRRKFENSSLCNADEFTRGIEQAYQAMWNDYIHGADIAKD